MIFDITPSLSNVSSVDKKGSLVIYLYSSVEFTPKDNKDDIVLWKLVKQQLF